MVFILSVGNDPNVLKRRSSALASAGYAIASVSSLPLAIEKIFCDDFDVLVLCNSLGNEERRWLLDISHRHRPSMPVVVVPESCQYLEDPEENDLNQLVLAAVSAALCSETGSRAA